MHKSTREYMYILTYYLLIKATFVLTNGMTVSKHFMIQKGFKRINNTQAPLSVRLSTDSISWTVTARLLLLQMISFPLTLLLQQIIKIELNNRAKKITIWNLFFYTICTESLSFHVWLLTTGFITPQPHFALTLKHIYLPIYLPPYNVTIQFQWYSTKAYLLNSSHS